jgi:ATP-dependent RNA helicase MSS116
MLAARNASTVARSFLRARSALRPVATAIHSSNVSLFRSSSSAAALAKPEVEASPSWEEYAEQPRVETTAPVSELPVEDPIAPPSPHLPFSVLKRRVNHDSLKALTKRPFNFEYMSEVQERVLSLMPDLVGFEERPPHGMSKEEFDAGKTEEERALPPPQKKDLLVKAKTGTGKTVVCTSPCAACAAVLTGLCVRRSWFPLLKGVYTFSKRRAKRLLSKSLEIWKAARKA